MIYILMMLAVARITRLVNEDTLTERPRSWLILRLNGHENAQYLITCPWCVSVYAGAGVAGVWVAVGSNPWFVGGLIALAASYVTGWLAENGKGE